MLYSAGENPGLISDVFVVREEFVGREARADRGAAQGLGRRARRLQRRHGRRPGDHRRGGRRQARGAGDRLRRRHLLLAGREQDRARRPLHQQGGAGGEGRRDQGRPPHADVDLARRSTVASWMPPPPEAKGAARTLRPRPKVGGRALSSGRSRPRGSSPSPRRSSSGSACSGGRSPRPGWCCRSSCRPPRGARPARRARGLGPARRGHASSASTASPSAS